MAGSRLDFSTGAIINPFSQTQSALESISNTIGSISKQYLDKQQHEERMAESKAAREESNNRFAQEMAANRDKFEYSKSQDAIAAGRQKVLDDRANTARDALSEIGTRMTEAAAKATIAAVPEKAKEVADIHSGILRDTFATKQKLYEDGGDKANAARMRDTLKAFDTLGLEKQQETNLANNPTELVNSLAKSSIDSDKLKGELYQYLISKGAKGSDAIEAINLYDRASGAVTPEERIAIRKNELDTSKALREAGIALGDIGPQRYGTSNQKNAGSGGVVENLHSGWTGTNSGDKALYNDTMEKVRLDNPNATPEQIKGAVDRAVQANSRQYGEGDWRITASPENLLASSQQYIVTGTSNNGLAPEQKERQKRAEELIEQSVKGLRASTVGLTKDQKAEVEKGLLVEKLLEQFPSGIDVLNADLKSNTELPAMIKEEEEEKNQSKGDINTVTGSNLVKKFIETDKVQPEQVKAYTDELIKKGADPKVAAATAENAIKNNNVNSLLALNPEYKNTSWLDRLIMKSNMESKRAETLVQARNNGADNEVAWELAVKDPAVITLTNKLNKAKEMADEANFVRSLQNMPSDVTRELLLGRSNTENKK